MINNEKRDWFYDDSKGLVCLEVCVHSAYGSYIMIEDKEGISKSAYTVWSWNDGMPPLMEGESNDFKEAYKMAMDAT